LPKERLPSPRAGHLELLKTLDRTNPVDDLFRNLARCLAQFFRQFEGERYGVLAQLHLGWLFDHNPGEVEVVSPAQKILHLLSETAFERPIQGIPLTY
jgi:hypothetical protein